MGLLGLFGDGGILNPQKKPGGLLGSLDPNLPLLMTGLGMLGGGFQGALPGLQAGMKQQQQRQGVKDWESFLGSGGSGAPQGGMGMPAVPTPMVGIGGPSPASPAGGMRAQSGGVPGNYGGVVDRIVGIESGGNPNARSTTSSATGAGQFIDSTWLSTVKKHRPDVAAGKSDPQILSLRTDPNLSREMIAAYAQDNAGFLQSRGLGTGPTEVYAAHNLGPAGAAKVLSAAPDTPLSSMFGADVMRANPHLRNMTARTYLQSIGGKMGGGEAPSAGAPAAGGGAMPSPQNAAMSFIAGLAPQQRAALARMAAQNPAIAGAFIERMIAGQKTQTTDDIQEFQFARQGGYTGSFMDYLAAKEPGSTPSLSFQKVGEDVVGLDQKTGQEVSRIAGAAKGEAAPSGYRWTPDKNLEVVPGGPADKKPDPVKLSDINTMRAQAAGRPNVSKYVGAAPIYNSMIDAVDKDTPAADLDFVYGTAQIYDPNSVVQEGEQRRFQSLGGLPGYLQNMIGWVQQGNRIPPSLKKEVLARLAGRVQEYKAAADAELAPFVDTAKRHQIDPADIMPGMAPMRTVPAAPEGQQPSAAPNTPRLRPQQVPAALDKSKLPRVTTKAEYDAVGSGQWYVEIVDGKEEVFRKP